LAPLRLPARSESWCRRSAAALLAEIAVTASNYCPPRRMQDRVAVVGDAQAVLLTRALVVDRHAAPNSLVAGTPTLSVRGIQDHVDLGRRGCGAFEPAGTDVRGGVGVVPSSGVSATDPVCAADHAAGYRGRNALTAVVVGQLEVAGPGRRRASARKGQLFRR